MVRRKAPYLSILAAIALLATNLVNGSAAPAAPGAATPLGQLQPGAVKRDVTYCSPGGVDLKMDIYTPGAGSPSPAPAVVYVHGGGWTSGDKSLSAPWVSVLGSQGYFAASINYRLAPQYRWPAQIEDVKCAVRHLRANAAAYNIDPDRIGAWGDSAGGHLVSLLGLTNPEAGFEGNGGYPEQSSSVQAVVDMFGPTDFATMDLSGPYSLQVARTLLGTTPDKAADALKRASPVTYVSKDAPPFLILQGDKDTLVPPSQSQELYDRLRAVGAPASLVMVKNAGHGFVPVGGNPSPSIPELSKIILDFFNQNLRNVGRHFFPETSKTVRGKFSAYWNTHGGLAQQGYPISEEMQETSETDGKVYTVQYFERAVFEYHPENSPPNDVLLSLLGSFLYKQKYPGGAPGQLPNTSPESVAFADTGKRLGGKFLDYWQKNGGLAQQGYPIAEEFQEKSDLDGKVYTVQYFERAVFELHPENKPPYDVLLSQLGTFRYHTKYGTGR